MIDKKDEALKLARDFISAEWGFGGTTDIEPSKIVRMLDEALAEQPAQQELKRIRSIISAVTGFEDDDEEYLRDAVKALNQLIDAQPAIKQDLTPEQPAQQESEAVRAAGMAGYTEGERDSIEKAQQPTDLDIALREMSETQDDLASIEITESFRNQLERVRLDVGVSPFVNLTDDLVKWVLLAHKRAIQPAQQQEPVADVNVRPSPHGGCGIASVLSHKLPVGSWLLYTSPPPSKPWVSLTDVEWMNIVNKDHAWFGQRPEDVAHEVAKLVEAKLREKNQ